MDCFKFRYFVFFGIGILSQSLSIDCNQDFQQCLREKKIDIDSLNKELKECRDMFVLSKDMKTTDFHEMFSNMCRNMDPTKCLKSFQNKVQVCLNDNLYFSIKQLIALLGTTRSFVCKDEGKRIADAFLNPKNHVCLFDNTPECEVNISTMIDPVLSMNDTNDDLCNKEEKMKICWKNYLLKNCDKDIFNLFNELSSELHRASPCFSPSLTNSTFLLASCAILLLSFFTLFDK